MAKERERKFLLKDESIFHETKSVHIQQAYLLVGKKSYLRVRIIDHNVAFLCYKYSTKATERDEFEYQIPLRDAEEMFKHAFAKLEKIRFSLIDALSPANGDIYQVDIDVYPSGKKVVEIEYPEELTNIPNYCGEEVTGVQEYNNLWIAQNEGNILRN